MIPCGRDSMWNEHSEKLQVFHKTASNHHRWLDWFTLANTLGKRRKMEKQNGRRKILKDRGTLVRQQSYSSYFLLTESTERRQIRSFKDFFVLMKNDILWVFTFQLILWVFLKFDNCIYIKYNLILYGISQYHFCKS